MPSQDLLSACFQFQMQRRKTYAKLPLQANYFPMPTAMFVENNSRRFNILSGQSLGAAYLKPGKFLKTRVGGGGEK